MKTFDSKFLENLLRRYFSTPLPRLKIDCLNQNFMNFPEVNIYYFRKCISRRTYVWSLRKITSVVLEVKLSSGPISGFVCSTFGFPVFTKSKNVHLYTHLVLWAKLGYLSFILFGDVIVRRFHIYRYTCTHVDRSFSKNPSFVL